MARSIEEMHEDELHNCERAFNAGLIVAAGAAADYCEQHRLAAPEWVVAAAAKHLAIAWRKDAPKKRGRVSGAIAECRRYKIDFERADEVDGVRRKQVELREEVEALIRLGEAKDAVSEKKRQLLLDEKKKMLDWVGSDLARAFACASMILLEAGADASGGSDAVKASYLRVKKATRNPEEAMRYYQFSVRYLRQLGLKTWFDQRQIGKPLYELMPPRG